MLVEIKLFPDRTVKQIAGQVRDFRPEEILPPKELKRVGRAVTLAIAATKEALQSAGVQAETMTLEEKRSWGVILGSGGGMPDFVEEQYRLYFNDQLRKVSAYNISSSTIGALSSEISLYFDLKGPSHVLSTGCTSSTDAIGYAFNLIRFGLADHLITGGADATITPAIMQGFCIMRAVSSSHNSDPRRASRHFDRRRDGFVLGEGAWILVLEERERALQRGATIYGEILGYASTCDAYHMVRLDPNGEEPARAMTRAIEDAGLAKDEVGYVALHGTSTVLNDQTETQAIRLCFGPRSYDIPMSSDDRPPPGSLGSGRGGNGPPRHEGGFPSAHDQLRGTRSPMRPQLHSQSGNLQGCGNGAVQLHRFWIKELGAGGCPGQRLGRAFVPSSGRGELAVER
ncbi:MAG: beta-ketoacyl-[acyl-carrier-protein] synthase family protein [Deltaproteobacteria bacterium]|nr:beta-ketoacyl-[acyl-carrier-protein] synthase family protein [Deltaproteobacteria bacterium]